MCAPTPMEIGLSPEKALASPLTTLWGLSIVPDPPDKCPVSSIGQSVNQFHDETLNAMCNLHIHRSAIVYLPIQYEPQPLLFHRSHW